MRYDKHEAAKAIGVSIYTLDNLRRANLIGYVRPSPRTIYFTQAHIDAYLAEVTHSAGVGASAPPDKEQGKCTVTSEQASITYLSHRLPRAERPVSRRLGQRT